MDKVQEGSLTERQQYWLNHIRACEASGKRIADYAVDHGINAQTMYASKKMLVKKGILPRTHSNRFQRAQLTNCCHTAHLLDSIDRSLMVFTKT